jgi:hypothetical protein
MALWLYLERKLLSVISFGAAEAWEKVTLDWMIRRGMGVERPWEAQLEGRGFVLYVICNDFAPRWSKSCFVVIHEAMKVRSGG